jgi:hypothetical protein
MARNAKLTIILAAMWAAFMLLPAIVNPAAAHSGHHHTAGSVLGVSPAKVALSREDPAPSEREADGVTGTTWFSTAAAQLQQECPEGSCSCGCVLCQGGFLAAQAPPEFLDEGQEKFELQVGVVFAKNLPDAIERPPRAAISL